MTMRYRVLPIPTATKVTIAPIIISTTIPAMLYRNRRFDHSRISSSDISSIVRGAAATGSSVPESSLASFRLCACASTIPVNIPANEARA